MAFFTGFFMKWFKLLIIGFLMVKPAVAEEGFDKFLTQMRLAALGQNISTQTIDKVFSGIHFLPKVIALDRKQSEFTITFEQYQKNQIVQYRINKARSILAQNKSIFDDIEKKYQVPREMIMALWAIETNFGQNTGGFHIASALATLAYEGRRADFFKDEFVKALKIIDEGHITAEQMKGSWAGAMGQCQFMPSSFLKYAVDYTGDGTKDIWKSQKDTWASIANYLHTEGWTMGASKYIKVISTPKNFIYNEDIEKNYRPISEFLKMGVVLNEPIDPNTQAKFIKPDRSTTNAAFVILKNFDVILHWNRSYFFALTAGRLSNAIKSGKI